jgi:hypothetical protein|tara:strand:+ start:4327 stop:4797 length:471 start_codon:yes stop_codon:yes gene_type:complete
MRKLFLSLLVMSVFTIANSQSVITSDAPKNVESTNVTIDFVSKVMDYGTIEHNSDGARKFVFTNNGTEPLLIKNAKGSCGCTVPTWPREPIAPGVTAEIGVKYATNRVGKFTKTITLTTNASKKPVILTIKGEVNPAPKEDTAPMRKTEGSPLEKK